MAGLTLDAGALIAFERNDRRVVASLARALDHQWALVVPAGVVGQVWRDGRRQARLARLLAPTKSRSRYSTIVAPVKLGSCVARVEQPMSSTRRWHSELENAATGS